MTRLRFEAAGPDGRVTHGTLEASHEEAAAAALVARGLYPLAITVAPTTTARLGRRDLAMLFQGLSALLASGVPLDRALASAESSSHAREAIQEIRAQLRSGRSLSQALASIPGVPAVAVGLVRAGEQSGLSAALGRAGAQLEREAELRRQVSAALAYPALLVGFGTIAVTVLVVFILPRFVALLGGTAGLPFSTRTLVALSGVVGNHPLLILMAMVFGALVTTQWVRTDGQRHLLAAPVVGRILLGFASSRAARTLAAMLGVGAPALAALGAAEAAAGNREIARRLRVATDRVRVGTGLSDSLLAERALSPSALQLLRIGEESGRVVELLEHGADQDERDATRALEAAVRLIEPTLIVLLGGVVAGIALAFLQGLYSLRPA